MLPLSEHHTLDSAEGPGGTCLHAVRHLWLAIVYGKDLGLHVRQLVLDVSEVGWPADSHIDAV